MCVVCLEVQPFFGVTRELRNERGLSIVRWRHVWRLMRGRNGRFDPRVRALLDFSIYLDISSDVKFAWKIQRDMAERGHSLESIKASIAARKPDFDAYVDPQKQYADTLIEVLPTQLIPDDNEGKFLRVRMVMKEGVKYFDPVYLFDEGSTISWIPCGRKLTCSYPGINFFYAPDTYYSSEVSVLEMDGQFDRLDELIYVENHLLNISTKFYGEITQQMLLHSDFPGSNNGTGLFQTIMGLKIRHLFEQIIAEEEMMAAAGHQSCSLPVHAAGSMPTNI
ncbi:hypothetical protein ACLOJK_025556 [Asimina triloba]